MAKLAVKTEIQVCVSFGKACTRCITFRLMGLRIRAVVFRVQGVGLG